MAELVGLVSSVISLAGAAAAVSLVLIECGNNVANARAELESLATEVRDLSSVLEYLGDTLKQYKLLISVTAVQTLERLVARCEKLLEELRLASELVKSKATRLKWLFRKPQLMEHKLNLEGFKSNLVLMMQALTMAKTLQQDSKPKDSGKPEVSSAAKRNLNLLRSAVLTNRSILQRLNDPGREGTNAADTSLSSEEKQARDELERNTTSGPVNQNEQTLTFAVHNLTWEKVLLNSYRDLSEAPSVSQTLNSVIPQQTADKASARKVKASKRQHPSSDAEKDSKASADQEIKVLLGEWTNIPKSDIEQSLRFQEFIPLPGVPRWVQDEYTFVGRDPNDPTHWKPKDTKVESVDKILPYSRFAYEPPEADRVSLYDLLAGEGGAWVWRHDNGYTRDYFVGNKKVVQYFVKPLEQTEVGELRENQERTIVGKQWVSKDVLEKSDHSFQSYGEGSWAIEGRLSPDDVKALHEAASKRTEELLQRLGGQFSKSNSAPKPAVVKAVALFQFSSVREGDLPFRKGDIITVLSGAVEGNAWWKATLNNKTGTIPANYVRLLKSGQSPEDYFSNAKFPGSQDGSWNANEPGFKEASGEHQADEGKNKKTRSWKERLESWRRKPRASESAQSNGS